MTTYDLIKESIIVLIEWVAFPGNATRTLFEISGEPWATISVSLLFVITFVLVLSIEAILRTATERNHVLMPNHVLTTSPDGGINAWALMFFWMVIQGPLSALL